MHTDVQPHSAMTSQQQPVVSEMQRKTDEHAPSLHRAVVTANSHPYANYPSSSSGQGAHDVSAPPPPRTRPEVAGMGGQQTQGAGSGSTDVRPRSYSSGTASEGYNWKRKRHLEPVRMQKLLTGTSCCASPCNSTYLKKFQFSFYCMYPIDDI